MDIFVDGELNTEALENRIRRHTQNLNDVLVAVAQTKSPTVESTHLLIALGQIPDGVTAKALSRLGLPADRWRSGLSECAVQQGGAVPPARLQKEVFDSSAIAALERAAERSQCAGDPTISEGHLLLGAIENATDSVRALFDSVEVSLDAWRDQIEEMITPVVPIKVFDDDGLLLTNAFSPVGRKILSMLQTETESLGYSSSSPRHLLLALLAQQGGATEYGLHQQGLLPRRIQEAVVLSLRRGPTHVASTITLDRDHMQMVLRRVLTLAGEAAARARAQRVGEAHLLRGLLDVETVARSILEDQKVDMCRLRQVAERYEPDAQREQEAEEQERGLSVADIDAVESRLKARLVGQGDAIARILPFVQRLKLGFSVQGRPEGVFLFCGASGTGKTEMAKELARAVFGSEDDLVFLEMGQFKGEHSMSIFVGAPPGYVGYGEGKLTNGLRDRPRSVVLFDEVEKADRRVLDTLLRFLDEGKIDDPAGPVRDGSQCIVVLTSNVGSDELGQLWRELEKAPDRQAAIRQTLRGLFKRHNFRVEFMNRVDELILFRPLDAEHYVEITRRFLESQLQRLREQCQIAVELDGVCEAIGQYCRYLDEGAREAHRLGLSIVVTPVINYVSRERCPLPVRVRVRAELPRSIEEGEPRGIVTPIPAAK